MAVKQRKTKAIAEFGDFQTPNSLALFATKLLVEMDIKPRSIVEPTCGKGAFVVAAATCFPEAESIYGVDINVGHLKVAEAALTDKRVDFRQGNFFELDWQDVITRAGEPWLVIGNPPWVTSAELGTIESANLPEKSNFHGRAGIDALMGKSNFDISEWMLLRYLDWLQGCKGTIAVLCKTAVARKTLLHIWKQKIPLQSASIYKIDASAHFGAAVDACFFVLQIYPNSRALSCKIFGSLDALEPSNTLGFIDGHVISDVAAFNKYRGLLEADKNYVWRSGVKHDCSKVMELTPVQGGFLNGLGEKTALEDEFLFPMLKSSDVGNGRLVCRGVMLVTQQAVGEETGHIRLKAPKTWDYLEGHAALLDKRGSVIYKNKPSFSVFGVGLYTFAPWKIAISGFYKSLKFVKVGPVEGRPVVFDDTIYFLPCWSEAEADFLQMLLTSEPASKFLHSMIHWDEKRPVTVDILKRLSVRKLAAALRCEKEYRTFVSRCDTPLEEAVRAHKTAA
jgi:hypothetical protein